MQITHIIRRLIRIIRKATLRGDKFYCPVCDRSYSRLLPMGEPSRPNARCPDCNSLERHRLLWAGIKHLQERNILKANGQLLHIAPEKCIQKMFFKNYNYVSADMYSPDAQIKTDVISLCFSDECFDVIICNHVLEHVSNDRKAISELYRVLKFGGWGIIQVPIKGEITLEDSSITDPAERKRLYGQSDHVRQYGTDFKCRLKETGFSLLELKKTEFLNAIELKRLSVDSEESVLFVFKPAP